MAQLSRSRTRPWRLPLAASLLAFLGCFASPSQVKTAKLDLEFTLKVGESATIEGEAMEVGFREVLNDSRCPKDAQCVWAGDAAVAVWLKRADGSTRELQLHTASKEQDSPGEASHQVALLSLDPQPVSSRPTAAADYVATLKVSRGSSSTSEQ